jgi:putative hemolysin
MRCCFSQVLKRALYFEKSMRYRLGIWIGLAFISILLVFLVLTGGCGNAGNTINTTKTNQTKNYPIVRGFEVDYCEKLGYTYDYRLNESSGNMEEYCRLSKNVECEAWDFASGTCHPEFSLCKKQGYLPKIGVEKKGNTTIMYPICIFSDGTYCKEVDFFKHNCHVDWKN